MAIHHRKQLEQMLLDRHYWRFTTALPSLDKGTFGQKLSWNSYDTVFQSDMAAYFKALLKGREGELLLLPGGSWKTERDVGKFPPEAVLRACQHVQYARTQTQRDKLVYLRLPGCPKPAIGGDLSQADLTYIGTTTVCKVQMGRPVAMMEATVVTWPQLFLLGLVHQFTAQEVFTAGWLCERILSGRVRPWKSETKMAAYWMAQNEQEEKGRKRRGVDTSQTPWKPWIPKG